MFGGNLHFSSEAFNFFWFRSILGPEKNTGGTCGHKSLVLIKKIILAGMALECTDRTSRTSRRAEIPPPARSPQRGAAAEGGRPALCAKRRLLSGGGISAPRLVQLVWSVHSCAMPAKIVSFLKANLLRPAAASGVLGVKNGSRLTMPCLLFISY